MKHLSRCVPATLSLILSFTPPGSLLADTGPFLSNSEVTVSSALTHIDAPPSSLSHRLGEQPQIILATGGIGSAVGRGLKNAGKAADNVSPPPVPPRPRPRQPDVDANDLPSPPTNPPTLRPRGTSDSAPQSAPGYVGARTATRPVKTDVYGPIVLPPRSSARALKVVKGLAITTLVGGALVGVGAGGYAGLIAGGLIEPIPGDDAFGPLKPQSKE